MDIRERSLKTLEYGKIINKLAGFTGSEMGRQKATELLPEKNADIVRMFLKETSDGVSFILRRGYPPAGGMNDIRPQLKRASVGSSLNAGELLKVAEVLHVCRILKEYSGVGKMPETTQSEKLGNEETGNCVYNLILRLEANMRIERQIRDSIISEEEISDSASPDLYDIRKKIRDRQNAIKDKLGEIIRSPRYQKFMQEAVVMMRGDRYVVPVKMEFKGEVPGVVHDMSASGATIFIEPIAVVEANNSIRELKVRENLEIDRILSILTAEVSDFAVQLETDVSILGSLDFIFAKAKLSLDLDCICPSVNGEGYISIIKGRHPLLDGKTVVPIDIALGKTYHTLVITGPNTGGKTVALKTLGLLALMTCAGLHIPAGEGTSIAVFDGVFADIGDEQSIEQSLSTFSSHMKNIVEVLKCSDDNSLVLLDELGAGTDPTEGAALAMAILDHLRLMGEVTAATTHYSEIKVYAAITADVENASCEFDVSTLKPTFRLLTGIPGKSNAFAISQRLNLPEAIIDKAKNFMTQEDLRFEDMLDSIEKNRIEAEKEKILLTGLKNETAALKNELEVRKRELIKSEDEILGKASEKAHTIIADASREAGRIIKELRRLETEKEDAGRLKAAEELRQKLRDISGDESQYESNAKLLDMYEESSNENDLPGRDLKPGDTVYITKLDKKGTVLGIAARDKQVLVQAGIIKVNVPYDSLRYIDGQKAANRELKSMGSTTLPPVRAVPLELDVRGLTVDEAVSHLEKHIDSAGIAGLSEVFVIHGKGTGALRAGIHRFLRQNPRVSSYRLGNLGEGDAGVTVITIKK